MNAVIKLKGKQSNENALSFYDSGTRFVRRHWWRRAIVAASCRVRRQRNLCGRRIAYYLFQCRGPYRPDSELSFRLATIPCHWRRYGQCATGRRWDCRTCPDADGGRSGDARGLAGGGMTWPEIILMLGAVAGLVALALLQAIILHNRCAQKPRFPLHSLGARHKCGSFHQHKNVRICKDCGLVQNEERRNHAQP